MTANFSTSFLCSKSGWIVTFSLGTLGAYLLWAHPGRLVVALPFLLLFACPLMHVFGHHGHDQQSETPK